MHLKSFFISKLVLLGQKVSISLSLGLVKHPLAFTGSHSDASKKRGGVDLAMRGGDCGAFKFCCLPSSPCKVVVNVLKPTSRV